MEASRTTSSERHKSGSRVMLWLAVGTLTCAAAVAFCYVFVDRQVAYLAHAAGWRDIRVLHWIQKIPHVTLWTAPAILVWLVFARLRGRWSHHHHFLLQVASGLALTVVLKVPLKFLFGRYWPATFRDGNPSLIGDGAYGFHPFHAGIAYDAFPSGHTAAIAAVATLIWLTYPRWRWLGVTAAALSAVGVIGLYYHFVSDVIAGVFFGGLMGIGVSRLLPQSRGMRDGGDTSDPG